MYLDRKYVMFVIQKVNKNDTLLQDESENDEVVSDSEEISYLEQPILEQQTLEEKKLSIQNLGESPFKLHSVAPHRKSSYAKRKLESVTSTLKSKLYKVIEKEFP